MKSKRHKKSKKALKADDFKPKVDSSNNKEHCMSEVLKIDVTLNDGTVQTLTKDPVVGPTDTEVDIVMSDGSVKKFVPAA